MRSTAATGRLPWERERHAPDEQLPLPHWAEACGAGTMAKATIASTNKERIISTSVNETEPNNSDAGGSRTRNARHIGRCDTFLTTAPFMRVERNMALAQQHDSTRQTGGIN